MSVGAFLGIRASFNDQAAAQAFLDAIDRTLRLARLPTYTELSTPPGGSGRFGLGRSELDHHSASVLAALGRRGRCVGHEHLARLESNPYRVAFLPIDFRAPLETEYRELIAGTPTPIWVGSSLALGREVNELAPDLGITLTRGQVSERTAALINEGESLDEEDELGELMEDERTAWLLLYEGARLSVTHGVALSLAG